MRKSEAGATEDEEETSVKADSDDDDLLAQAVAAVEAQGGGKKKKLFSKRKVPSREPSDPLPAVSFRCKSYTSTTSRRVPCTSGFAAAGTNQLAQP